MCKERDALIPLGQRLARQRHFTLTGFGKQKPRLTAVIAPTDQHAGLFPMKKQDRRQQGGVDIVQHPPDNSARQTCPRGGTGKLRWRQTTTFQRQASRERRTCARAAV